MDIKSVFGGVSIGKDTSGYFKISANGLAVKTLDGKYITYVRDPAHANKDHLLDVSGLTLDGGDNFIYRIPVTEVERGDLIITSETPFSALFVRDDAKANEKLSGLDPQSNRLVDYVLPTNLFNVRFFVKVFNLIQGGGLGKLAPGGKPLDPNLLQLLLLGDKTDDSLALFLLAQGLGGGALAGKALDINSLIPLLLLSDKGGKSDILTILLLTQILGQGGAPPPKP
jgi:hypothetical protein